MIDHVALNVKDLKASRAFYEKTLAPLGIVPSMSFPDWEGFGAGGKAEFWLVRRDPAAKGLHLALRCSKRSQVDAFHAAALKAGGTDHGKPGIREDYSPDYYAAFILDPDGNNIEVVCKDSQG